MLTSTKMDRLRWKYSMGTTDMYLYGASGHAKVICDIIEDTGNNVLGFIDDNENIVEFKGKIVEHIYHKQIPLIISIGNNSIRKKIADKGTVIMQGCIIQSESHIGKHCIINTGSSIDHECLIDDFVHISPHATLCGNVHVGEGTWIGAGSTIIQGVKIGKWCVIGAGSVVTKDVPDGYLAVGNRCKLIKQINKNLL